MADGWTVAETAQVQRPSSSASNRTGRQTPTLSLTSKTPEPQQQQQQQRSTLKRQSSSGREREHRSHNHVRWSDNFGGSSGALGGRSQSEEELDRLLDGLEQLTETLPDVGGGGGAKGQRTRGEGASPPPPTPKSAAPSGNSDASAYSSRGISSQVQSSPTTTPPSAAAAYVRRKEIEEEEEDRRRNYSSSASGGFSGASALTRDRLLRETDIVDAPGPRRPELPAHLRSHLARQDGVERREEEEEEVQFPSVKQTRQLLQSRDTYGVDGSSYSAYSDGGGQDTKSASASSRVGAANKPYHTLKDSKPFSYIRNNSELKSALGEMRRSGSREAGLESPGLLRKIMGGGKEETDSPNNYSNGASTLSEGPMFSSTPKVSREEESSKKRPTYVSNFHYSPEKKKPEQSPTSPPTAAAAATKTRFTESHLEDVEASLSWLERQQRKLQDRRDVERRRGARGQQDAAVVSELKSNFHSTVPTAQQHQARSETTTDGYASDLASMIYSETSTRESSPHKFSTIQSTSKQHQQQYQQQQYQQQQTRTIPVRIEPSYHQQQQQQQQQYQQQSSYSTVGNGAIPNSAYNSSYNNHQQYQQQQEQHTYGTSSHYGGGSQSRYQQHRGDPYGRQQQQPYGGNISNSTYGPYSGYGASGGGTSLSRQRSDTSFDRSRPFISRRLRYDSESESELVTDLFSRRGGRLHGSNTSLDSGSLHWGHGGGGGGSGYYSQPGSRPITPAFPAAPGTPVFGTSGRTGTLVYGRHGSRSVSPGATSLYSQHHHVLPGGRRGSVSSSGGDPAEVPAASVRLVKDSYRLWYKPDITREEAIAALRHRPPGSFVVRDSNSFPGAFGLALKVAVAPPNANGSAASSGGGKDPGSELVRHFLIEPTSKGVRLKGYANEPVFASLSALVYQVRDSPTIRRCFERPNCFDLFVSLPVTTSEFFFRYLFS